MCCKACHVRFPRQVLFVTISKAGSFESSTVLDFSLLNQSGLKGQGVTPGCQPIPVRHDRLDDHLPMALGWLVTPSPSQLPTQSRSQPSTTRWLMSSSGLHGQLPSTCASHLGAKLKGSHSIQDPLQLFLPVWVLAGGFTLRNEMTPEPVGETNPFEEQPSESAYPSSTILFETPSFPLGFLFGFPWMLSLGFHSRSNKGKPSTVGKNRAHLLADRIAAIPWSDPPTTSSPIHAAWNRRWRFHLGGNPYDWWLKP